MLAVNFEAAAEPFSGILKMFRCWPACFAVILPQKLEYGRREYVMVLFLGGTKIFISQLCNGMPLYRRGGLSKIDIITGLAEYKKL